MIYTSVKAEHIICEFKIYVLLLQLLLNLL